ncbi:hypothetical protein GCM10007160_16530 [Litchfieldella qijiaojingensis]|uniref:Uncharacterized protein n=1 Tax=Litchfieldella qijiaojingensis TaxID=980347 RepID=A0ABQ2YQP1_9GAMM|nr:hypothetical protein [Halomonas qijiaojingensis]GGX89826.1 hypothetical protein GCM10007160_16530 [Halomonas qijiaojingensis]
MHRCRKRILAYQLAAVLALTPGLPGLASTTSDDVYPQYGDDGNGDDNGWKLPAIVAGAAALLLVGRWMQQRSQASQQDAADDSDMLEQLQKRGPEFPAQYNSSAFAAIGTVRGDWPFVLDFSHDRPVIVTLRISARDVPDIYTVRLPFGADETGRHRVQFRLPPAFGDSERPAAISVTATDMSGERTEPTFRVQALGCGPRAVGSVAIEEVSFLPRRIRAQAQEQASYRFFSHSDFPSAVAEFMRIEEADDGERHFFVNEEPIAGGVTAGRSIDPRLWDGRDERQRISTGTHRLKVRAWAPTGGWVTAWSDSRVNVSL